jgi:hypothetical protein
MFKDRENKTDSLSDELRHYCDELSEFDRRCERLCKALAEIATHHESISSFSVRGMRHNANWLKYRVNDFSRRLHALYEKTLNERQ